MLYIIVYFDFLLLLFTTIIYWFCLYLLLFVAPIVAGNHCSHCSSLFLITLFSITVGCYGYNCCFFTFIASHKSNFVCYLIVIISFHWHCLLMLFLLHTFVTHAIIVFLLTILVSFIVDWTFIVRIQNLFTEHLLLLNTFLYCFSVWFYCRLLCYHLRHFVWWQWLSFITIQFMLGV